MHGSTALAASQACIFDPYGFSMAYRPSPGVPGGEIRQAAIVIENLEALQHTMPGPHISTV